MIFPKNRQVRLKLADIVLITIGIFGMGVDVMWAYSMYVLIEKYLKPSPELVGGITTVLAILFFLLWYKFYWFKIKHSTKGNSDEEN